MLKMTRRELMVRGSGLGMAAVGVMLSIPALGFLLSPLFTKSRTVWVTVGPIDDIQIGQPTALTAMLPPDQGWPVPAQPRIVYVVKLSESKILALSNICTHMQCNVHWDQAIGQFLCPCHGGLYTLDGTNVGGPPPLPLAQWVHRITYDAKANQHLLEIQNRLDENI
jgi:Rieske Fe-S protein